MDALPSFMYNQPEFRQIKKSDRRLSFMNKRVTKWLCLLFAFAIIRLAFPLARPWIVTSSGFGVAYYEAARLGLTVLTFLLAVAGVYALLSGKRKKKRKAGPLPPGPAPKPPRDLAADLAGCSRAVPALADKLTEAAGHLRRIDAMQNSLGKMKRLLQKNAGLLSTLEADFQTVEDELALGISKILDWVEYYQTLGPDATKYKETARGGIERVCRANERMLADCEQIFNELDRFLDTESFEDLELSISAASVALKAFKGRFAAQFILPTGEKSE
jgi:hypothetical protein